MRKTAAHALLWGGLATMIGGVYMLAGPGWAAFVGGFMVYAVGNDLMRKHREREAVETLYDAHKRLCEASPFLDNATLQGGKTPAQTFAAVVKEMQRQQRN